MLHFTTPDPKGLLDALDNAIEAKAIRTWVRNDSGYYGHTSEQWRLKAFFCPILKPGRLGFSLTCVEANVVTYERRAVFAFYHGHLIETFVNHFASRYSLGCASSVPVKPADDDF